MSAQNIFYITLSISIVLLTGIVFLILLQIFQMIKTSKEIFTKVKLNVEKIFNLKSYIKLSVLETIIKLFRMRKAGENHE